MRTLGALLGSIVLVVALGACSQAARFSMEGSYAMTIIVSETNTPGVTIGEVGAFAVTITTAGDQVEATVDGVFVATGTRSGNSVMLEGSGGGSGVWTFDLTWTSETAFEGEGRMDDGPEYVEFVVHGMASPLLAAE